MPPVAQRYPCRPSSSARGDPLRVPRVQYASIVDRLGDRIARRAIVAHLGNGASMAALRDGKSVDMTMGFTPLGGLMMGTRPGDLDPGLMLYLLQQTGRGIDEVADPVANHAGLRGVSQRSADMKTLLHHEDDDPRVARALELYVYLARKQLGGSGRSRGSRLLVSPGELASTPPRSGADLPRVRLGRNRDRPRRTRHATVISYDDSPVRVMVLPSDEERMIARATVQLIERRKPHELRLRSRSLLGRCHPGTRRPAPKAEGPLSPELLDKMLRYWQASNYLTVGQIYLQANPLLRDPLTVEQIKPRLLGHWGTSPGLNLIYVQLNRLIQERDADAIYLPDPDMAVQPSWRRSIWKEPIPKSTPRFPRTKSVCASSSANSRPRAAFPVMSACRPRFDP